jgi:hypothetical protein
VCRVPNQPSQIYAEGRERQGPAEEPLRSDADLLQHATGNARHHRFKPGFGYRHILKKKDVLAFIELLPDWKELSKRLRAVILAPGDRTCSGWYRSTGIVAICAWQRDLWWLTRLSHEDNCLMKKIGLPFEQTPEGYLWKWTESTIRAYQLLDVFLHELGHHHDRMTTKSQRRCCRGENYAEQYALRYAEMIWERYLDRFGMP